MLNILHNPPHSVAFPLQLDELMQMTEIVRLYPQLINMKLQHLNTCVVLLSPAVHTMLDPEKKCQAGENVTLGLQMPLQGVIVEMLSLKTGRVCVCYLSTHLHLC